MPVSFRGGLFPNDPSKPRLRLGPFIRATYSLPVSADYYSHVDSWGMLGNDQWGDCVFAENGHIAEQQTALGLGTEQVIATSDALAEYSRVTGFDPNAGPSGSNSTDNGSTVQDGLGDLRVNGIAGFKVAAFAQLDHTNMTEVETGVAQFGMVDCGIVVTQGDMDAFNAGAVWDGSGDQTQLGGHCVGLAGYDADYLYIVTWGAIQKATRDWWNARAQEAWVAVSTAWADNGGGMDPEGVDLYGLGQEFTTMTGDPNPFPPPPPPPAPEPPPAPIPAPPAPPPAPEPSPPAPPAPSPVPIPPPEPPPAPIPPTPTPTPVPPAPDRPGCVPGSGLVAKGSRVNLVPWVKSIFKEEPALVAWIANGGLTALYAYVFHATGFHMAVVGTVLTGLAALATAIQTRPFNVSVLSGALTTLGTAMAGFGLHVPPKTEAYVLTLLSTFIGLIVRGHVTPTSKKA